MIGPLSLSVFPPELIARLFGTRNPLPNLRPTWNMAPTMGAPVVRRHPETGERHLDALIWGLVPSFTQDLKVARKPINARAETVGTSGMFRMPLAKRRYLVLASAFYEWKATPDRKMSHAIARADGDRGGVYWYFRREEDCVWIASADHRQRIGGDRPGGRTGDSRGGSLMEGSLRPVKPATLLTDIS